MFKVLTLSLLIVGAAAWVPDMSQFCGKYECPKHKDLDTADKKYQARTFYAGKWVGTDMDVTMKLGERSNGAFMRLFKYIGGANANNTKIDMTAPVMSQWSFDAEGKLTKARMNFYIPTAHQASPPAPTDPSVTIVDMPETTLYYRAFGGMFFVQGRYTANFAFLKKLLTADSTVSADLQQAVTLEYNHPFSIYQRHEAAFVAK